MQTIFGQFGAIVEITQYEKEKFGSHKKRQANVLFTVQGIPRYRPRRFDSIVRAKKICLRRVSCAIAKFGSPLFLTLTFGGNAHDVYDANKALTAFQWRLRLSYPNAVSIFVPELSPRGRIHFHGLVFNLPSEWGDKRLGGRVVSHGSERTTRTLAQLWRVGFLDCRQTDGSPKLAAYVSKYITKSGRNPLFDKVRLIRVSRGFPRELVIKGAFADFLAYTYANSFVENNLWSKTTPWLGLLEQRTYFRTSLAKKAIHILPLDKGTALLENEAV